MRNCQKLQKFVTVKITTRWAIEFRFKNICLTNLSIFTYMVIKQYSRVLQYKETFCEYFQTYILSKNIQTLRYVNYHTLLSKLSCNSPIVFSAFSLWSIQTKWVMKVGYYLLINWYWWSVQFSACFFREMLKLIIFSADTWGFYCFIFTCLNFQFQFGFLMRLFENVREQHSWIIR